jgi:hypothetical protein
MQNVEWDLDGRERKVGNDIGGVAGTMSKLI